jgi:hypothetical protein
MPTLKPLLFATTLACGLLATQSSEADKVDRTKCVGHGYDHLSVGDIELGQLILDDRKFPSEEEQSAKRHKAEVTKILSNAERHDGSKKLYLMTTMGDPTSRRYYRQLGAALICQQHPAIKDAKCRNRTYFFFVSHEPAELARIVLTDIVKKIPIVRCCPTNWAGGGPKPPSPCDQQR